MRRFLKRLFLFALPLLALLSLAEYGLRKIPNDYSLKARVYQERGGDFETLILGNSHAFYDLDPAFFKSRTFNGAHVAQTLDLDAAIFNKFEPQLTRLKCLVISLSDMSLFWELDHSKENWRLKNYSVYYEIPASPAIRDHFEILSLPFSINRNRLIDYYWRHQTAITCTGLGHGNNYRSGNKPDLIASAREVIKVHTIKDHGDFPHLKRSLEQILLTCRRKKIRVILFLPPAYSAYASRIDSFQLKTTLQTAAYFTETYKNVSFLNVLNDPLFTENDYYDADHLNETGAKKMSLKIDSVVDRLLNENF